MKNVSSFLVIKGQKVVLAFIWRSLSIMSPLEQSYQAPSLSYMKGYVEDI